MARRLAALAAGRLVQVLRHYQEAALDSLREGFRSGRRRWLLVAPTGSGKTTIFAAMVRGAVGTGRRCLIVAHRRELIDQAYARLEEHGIRAGVVASGDPRVDWLNPVQVASVQTLARRTEWPAADLVLIDEAHHAAADSYRRIFDRYPNAFFVGPTATPWRADGRGLGEHAGRVLFDGLVVAATTRELIDEGFLSDYCGFTFEAPPALDRIKTRCGDYDEGALEVACDTEPLRGKIVETWLKHAAPERLRTIVFAVSTKHSEHLLQAFGAACAPLGLRAESVDYRMDFAERRAVLDRVRSGATTVVINCTLLGEGIDIPELACAVLARPTKSVALYLQQCGRVLRPAPGKAIARIHDHGGCILRLGLPDADRQMDLLKSAARTPVQPQAEQLEAIRVCAGCCCTFVGAVCPACGTIPAAALPSEREGRAVDLASLRHTRQRPTAADLAAMAAYRAELVATAIERGHDPGYVVHRFMARFPDAPKPWKAYREVKEARAAASGDSSCRHEATVVHGSSLDCAACGMTLF